MSDAHRYIATVRWNRNGAVFTDRRYSRLHRWAFDSGIEVDGSSSPLVVRVPFSEPNAIDPEEAFTASVASCHLLFFLDFAAQSGFVVDTYADTATATMGKNAAGRDYIATIDLAPAIVFSGERIPSADELAALHERAHDACYIANSILTDVIVR